MTKHHHGVDNDGGSLTRRSFLTNAGLVLVAAAWPRCPALPAGEAAVKPPKFLLAWGKRGTGQGEFISPIALAVNRADEVFVSSFLNGNNARIQKFTADGKFLVSFAEGESILSGIAVDAQGNVYAARMGEHKVCVFAADGKLVRQWGKKGEADGEFNEPAGIVIGRDGSIYVADQVNRRVQRFTPQVKFLAKWGEYGSKPGQFDGIAPGVSQGNAYARYGGPHFLGIDSQGNLFTTESVQSRVQQFTADGKPLRAWGDKSNEPGGLGDVKLGKYSFGPIGICVDKQDRVWVSGLNNRVQCFSAEGKYLTGIGGTGDGPGQFRRPHALVVDSKGYLYVADSGNHRIQKFEVSAR